ncbi:MAG: UdgX family uracil-DNA binding protein [Vulcanimicrobiaceae bacterium]
MTDATAYLPERLSLTSLRRAVADCQACDLYRDATQAVFGEGRASAEVMLVGEQPGDNEDREGRPFVGPAGRFFHAALDEAGLDAKDLYITGAVKHFKFIWRGKRRIHATPKRIEVRACHPWLVAELEVVQPRVLVALGATAAKALFGPSFRVTQHRGEFIATPLAPYALATLHPAAILRAPDDEVRRVERARFVDDLRLVAQTLRRR